ncbi:radical SAM/SPASM domain-containing protein [Thermospira aquatica]|uniref:Radical SAM protein n=1 Tax=Thermospira aquatica TaxID=2828656 RepID=A0AAX3BFF4_9SPIR|nr:radical SAM protein [Thermospira aquatica]URA10961.1 radical SAM protein [Thermospira aquatica]
MKTNYAVVTQLMMRNPRAAADMALAFFLQQVGFRTTYRRRDGYATEMPLITFRITPLCNLRCIMCGQRGLTGTFKDDVALKEKDNIVPLEVYKKLTDQVAKKTKVFYIWGGEPMLYPNFMELAAYMARTIPLFTVNTNGTLLAPHAKEIVRDKWSGFFISLDGFEETNDAIRGKGSYKRVIESIQAINEEKKRQKATLPHVGIVTTISNMNYKYLDKLVEATKDMGLAWHIVNLGTYTNTAIGQEHERYMEEKLGITPYYWRGFANGCNEGIDGEEFSQILARAHSIKTDHPLITVPVIRPKKIGEYYANLDHLVRDKCTAPWFSVNINYNGDVHFCADYPDYILGNIMQEDILDIYNNERARTFRKALRESPHGIFPGCRRCYQLMLCGHRRWGY